MRTTTFLLPGLLALVLVPPYAHAAQEPPAVASKQSDKGRDEKSPTDVHVFWKDGFRIETNDGQFQLRIGGRLHTDLNQVFEKEPFGDRFGRFESGSEIRRARLHLQGYLYQRVEYKFELDFAGGSAAVKDMYLGIRGWPVTARFGHLKEPFSLEEQTSSRFITFIERSLVNLFSPGRNTGLVVGHTFNGGRSTWAAGLFRDTDGFASSHGDNYDFTGRFTHALVRSDDSRRIVHLGLALQHKEVDGSLRLIARPGDHLEPNVIDIRIPATSANLASFEASANVGSLGLQAEYVSSWTRSAQLRDPRLWGYYLQGSYVLTGEARPYSGGRFVRLKPRRNFPDGSGAWEIALRYARVDLSEASPTPPNTLWNLTAGLNWYWNPNVRLTVNYELGEIAQMAGKKFSSLHMRFGLDF